MVGKIIKVPLREVWKHEAHDFTTWLQNNIEVLNTVIDFQLSNPEREKSTGNFNVDLIAEDEEGNVVVIENQLEKSNHDHLGKVITYLASVGASKAIWIVAEPRQEHVKAISWLNESTSANFYLLKLEGVKIGESDPAPLFTLIVGPSDEVREAGDTKKEFAERHHLRKEFWNHLLKRAKDRTKLHANNSPGIYHWVGAGAGIGGVTFNYVITKHEGKVELYIDKDKTSGEGNKLFFDMIYKHKSDVETLFGSNLSWERMDTKRASRISKSIAIGGYADREKWELISQSMIDNMIKLEQVLSPIISTLR